MSGHHVNNCGRNEEWADLTWTTVHPRCTRGTGTGLKVLYQTIQLLNDKNREKIRFEIKNLVNNGQTGTQVLIYIPLDYSYNL